MREFLLLTDDFEGVFWEFIFDLIEGKDRIFRALDGSEPSDEEEIFLLDREIYLRNRSKLDRIIDYMDAIGMETTTDEFLFCRVRDGEGSFFSIEPEDNREDRLPHGRDRLRELVAPFFVADMMDEKDDRYLEFIRARHEGDTARLIDDTVDFVIFPESEIPPPSQKIDGIDRIFSDDVDTVAYLF